ncbi:SpoIIE family protein phosphatase [Streptomyces sp. LP05-1]|uniref:SpoIIE family protein phosphatase n=1 Tax=Streptomyces pyxinae TaxID=2970734 RepID=A0ABT2CLW9_9ACTN|nr:SpoIIE family protein phosphatase [Streptomyces sp. LP05-1]MCS0638441.1 SpoIIE family protein phosphatase [Streptomyces sp. LP05-1]
MSAEGTAGGYDFRGPLDAARAATAVLDAEGVIVGWGPAAEALLGHAPHEVLGRPIGTLVVDRAGAYAMAAPLPGAAGARRQVLYLRHRDGRITRAATESLPLAHAGTGGPARLLAIADADETERWEALQSMLRGLATQSPVGLAIYDTDIRIVWTNHALHVEMGTSQYAGLGPDEQAADGEVISPGYPATLEETMRRVLATGEPVIELHYRGRPPVEPDRPRVWSCSYYRLQDGRGTPLGVCEETVDITDRHLAQQRLDLLVQAGRHMGTSLDTVRTAEQLAAVTVPGFADAVTVDVLADVLTGGQLVPASATTGRVVRVFGGFDGPEAPDGPADRDKDREAEPSGGRETEPSGGREADPSGGRETELAGGHGAEPSGGRETEPSGGHGAEPSGAGAPGDRDGAGRTAGAADHHTEGHRTDGHHTGHPDHPGGAGTDPGAIGGRPVRYPPESPQARCLATGEAVRDRPGPGGDPDPDGTARLVVPLRADGATLGVVTFVRHPRSGVFRDDDLPVADELAARTAVSVDNARRYTREHNAALTLQRSLLPRTLPPLTGVEVAHRYLPADSGAGVGGDWFDVIALSGTRVGLVVGDVVGHGVRAAATMGRLRTSLRVLARLDLPPDELLTRLDDVLTQDAHEYSALPSEGSGGPGGSGGEDPALGATCLYAVYDPVAGRCSLARAGHAPPLVVDPATGAVSQPEVPAGPPLGLGGLPFESADLELPEGSLLALYTDGLVQGRGRDRDAEVDALGRILARHREPLETLGDRAVATLLPGPVGDDAALLLVRTRHLDRHEVAAWELDSDPGEVGRARSLATGQVAAWGLDGELAFTTELVVSELVTNAVRYASGPIQLRLIRDRSLICEVSDTGHTTPHVRRAGGEDEGGRGLFLVAGMTHHWGTRYTSSGKTIWAEQTLPAS